ncbi:MAG: DUF4129 domain-containing protein [Peptococcaceae bacterium]
MIRSLFSAILSIIVEASYLYPIYYLAAFTAKTQPGAIINLAAVYFIAGGVTIINYLLAQKERRIITVVIINLILLMGVYSYFVKALFYPARALLHPVPWIAAGNVLETVQHVFLLLFILWTWLRAFLISRKELSYSAAASRFELSMAIMFCVLLALEFLAVPSLPIYYCFAGVLLANLGSLALTSSRGSNTFWLGIIPALVVVPVLAVMNNYKPFFNHFFQLIFEIFKPVVILLRDIFAAIMVFLLTRTHMIPQAVVNTGNNNNSFADANLDQTLPGGYLFTKIFSWLLAGLALIGLGIIVFFLVQKILSKLFSVSPPNTGDLSTAWWILLLRMLTMVLKRSILIFNIIFVFLLPRKFTVKKAYQALLKWGKYRHQPREDFETPWEYYLRLARIFPGFADHFKRITECYLESRYGYKNISSDICSELKSLVVQLYLPVVKNTKKFSTDN